MLNKLKSFHQTLISTNGLRATFIVIFVATMLTIYELSMFYFVVVPKVNSQINSGINDVAENMKDAEIIGDNLYLDNDYLKELDNVVNTLRKYDENNRLGYLYDSYHKYKSTALDKFNKNFLSRDAHETKINTFKSIFETFQEREDLLLDKINNYTVATSFFLLGVLCIIMFIIKSKLNDKGEDIGKCVWVLSFITLFMIMIFQYAFYVFGNKYNYLGSEGNEELIYYLLKKL